jgi:hypothetical protein
MTENFKLVAFKHTSKTDIKWILLAIEINQKFKINLIILIRLLTNMIKKD